MFKNAKTLPQRYFGLHMCEGVAEYEEPGKKPYRIFIGEETLKNMDPSFEGRPVFVRHVEKVDLDNIQEDADGYVIRSFFNSVDGKHWVEFLVVSDKGHEAIRNGWKLSNAYIPKQLADGGLWHGVQYSKEIRNGEYEHLALVQNPRYEESRILTPDEFKQYNGEKELELKRLANEKEKGESMLTFFKKTKVENSKELETATVVLPTSKKEILVSDLVSEMDKIENMHGYANEEHMVKLGNEEMSVKDLVMKHEKMCQELEELKKNKEAPKDEKKPEEMKNKDGAEKAVEDKKAEDNASDKSEDKKDEKKPEEKKENEEKDEKAEDKKENEEAKDESEKKENEADESKKHFETLKNAHLGATKEDKTFLSSEDKVARGRERYGSGR